MTYKLLTHQKSDMLTAYVNSALKDGWKLYEGPHVATFKHGGSWPDYVFCQAVIKEEDER